MRALFLLPVILLLASCAPPTTTVFEQPSFAMGGAGAGACVEQCDIQAVQCRQGAAAAVGACQSADRAISAGFNGCRAGSPGCVAAPICLADTASCTAQYNSCFNSCGGLARTIRTPYLNPDAMPSTPFVVPPLGGAAPAIRRPALRQAAPMSRPAPELETRTGPSRDQFIRDEQGVDRFVPGQPIRIRRAPAG